MPARPRRITPRDRRADLEHIEVVTPGDPSWWDDAPPSNWFPTPEQAAGPSRRRRRLVIGGAAVVGLIAAATVTLLTASDDADVPAAEPLGHFIMDWADLRKYSADIVTPLPTDARYTLFTSGNPTNPWISLQTFRQRRDVAPAMDSFRREFANRNLITPRDERSMTTIAVDLGEGWNAEVRAFNVEDRQLVQFANSLRLADEPTAEVLFDESILAANNLMTTRTANWADELLYGAVTTEMRAEAVEGGLVTLREATAEVDTRLATLGYFTTGRVEGSDGYTAATLTPSGESIVTWAEAGRLLSLTGYVPTATLLAISQSVRLADATEWRSLVYGLSPDYRLGDFAEVNAGLSTGALPWRSGIQLATRGGRTEYLWWWTRPGMTSSESTPTGIDLSAGPGNETVVIGTSTFVFVWVPADSIATAASVRAADGTTVQLQLRLFFADVPVRLAATRIDVPGPVEISTA
jgi:hypothetical protein